MAKGINVKTVYELKEKVRYSYIEDELEDFFTNYDTDDVLIYGLIVDKINSLKWRITDENGMITKTEDNEEYYNAYLRYHELLEKYGYKLIWLLLEWYGKYHTIP